MLRTTRPAGIAPTVRGFVGQPVRVALAGGLRLDGVLVSFDGRSLWLVANGEDRFVPLPLVDGVVGLSREVRPV